MQGSPFIAHFVCEQFLPMDCVWKMSRMSV